MGKGTSAQNFWRRELFDTQWEPFRLQPLWFVCFSHRFLIPLISSMQAIHANSLESVNSPLSFSAAILLLAGIPTQGIVPGKCHMQSATGTRAEATAQPAP